MSRGILKRFQLTSIRLNEVPHEEVDPQYDLRKNDHTMGKRKMQSSEYRQYGDHFQIDLFGRDVEGRLVHAIVREGWNPYVYVSFNDQHCDELLAGFRREVEMDWRVMRLVKSFAPHVGHRSYMYTPDEQRWWKITLKSHRAYCKFVNYLQSNRFHRSQITSDTQYNQIYTQMQFMCDRDITPGSWVQIRGDTQRPHGECTIDGAWEHSMNANDVERARDDDGHELELPNAPLRILAYDIETNSPNKRNYAGPDVERAYVIGIGATSYVYDTDSAKYRRDRRVYFGLRGHGRIDDEPDIDVRSYETECDLLLAWAAAQRGELDHDFALHWNGYGFDEHFLYVRMRRIVARQPALARDMMVVGRRRNTVMRWYPKSYCSSANGVSIFKLADSYGRASIDVMQWVRRNQKLRSYSLHYVSSMLFPDRADQIKIDLPYQKMWEIWADGTDAERSDIAKYCMRDAELSFEIAEYYDMFTRMFEMCRIVYVPLDAMLKFGQKIRCTGQMYKAVADLGYVFQSCRFDWKRLGMSGKGGYVFTPQPRYYNEDITATIDFASLYPNIIYHFNIGPSTLIDDSDLDAVREAGVGVYTVTLGAFKINYAQDTKGLFPKLVERTLKYRSDVKKLMRDEKDPTRRALLDNRQLSIKLAANSIYGYLYGENMAVGCSVTSTGRDMTQLAARLSPYIRP